MDSTASSVTGSQPEGAPLRERAERAFVEVQRADTKATALCGVAGGLLAVEVAVLSSIGSMPRTVVWCLALVSVLLLAAVGAALLALRPVVPRNGLDTELVGDAVSQRDDLLSAGRSEERRREMRTLRVLAYLADRKLRSVRVAVDLVLAALLVAGMGLLSCYAFD
ncbi:hypothetical protein [Streptomyces sp. CA-132043]|uniref:hypothetical protein n=1 Tax=Streptomyces sp. CA-132043 TaxID=3240048 RepID=UPI003D94D55E